MIPCDEHKAKVFLDELVNNNKMAQRLSEQLLERYKQVDSLERGENLYGLYSTLTYWASHNDEQWGFGIRDTGNDHEFSTQLDRGHKVRTWITSAEAKKLFWHIGGAK